MAALGIKTRVLLVALLPGALIALALAFFFVHDRFADLEAALHQRGRALARQLAPAAEYAMFSGNREALAALAQSVAWEPDLKAIRFLGKYGELLAGRGDPAPLLPAALASDPGGDRSGARSGARSGVDSLVFTAPIVATAVRVDDVYGPSSTNQEAGGRETLGQVVVELSEGPLRAKRVELLATGLAVTLVVLGLSSWLALHLSRGVTRPLQRITKSVQRIGKGDLTVRVAADSSGALRGLEEGLNDMAAKLQSARDDLESRIADATEQLQDKKEEAERANRAKSRFLAAASHDLRQPMHALSLFVAQLAQGEHEPGVRELIRNIEASVGALDDLLHALLDVSKLDAGVMVPTLSDFPIAGLLARIGTDYGNAARKKGLRLRVACSRLWLRSDPLLLERVLVNLVANAVRYTDQGGILIGCRRRGNAVRIEVRDSGIGIAPESQAVIFREFVQLKDGERDRGEGLGLGLAIVERLARLLGHPISVHSLPGKGSIFSIEVPAAEMPAQTAPTAPLGAGGLLEGRSILVVDDDALVRQSLGGLLESWGCAVSVAHDQEEALAACPPQRPPDLIVCDFRLRAGADGIALIQRIRVDCARAVPAILVTGDVDADVARRAQAAGLPVLHKPVRSAKLRAALQSVLAMTENTLP